VSDETPEERAQYAYTAEDVKLLIDPEQHWPITTPSGHIYDEEGTEQ
jgi:hypothetical protein